MRRLLIEIPEDTARDLTAPPRTDSESPTEVRRSDAREAVADLVRDALALGVAWVDAPTAKFMGNTSPDPRSHIGHNVVICSEHGDITGMRCEDCDVAVDTDDLSFA